MSLFKSSENIQTKEGGPGITASNNLFSSINLHEQRKDTVISKFQRGKACNKSKCFQIAEITYANDLKNIKLFLRFHFMFVHYTFSSVWVAEWPPFGK